MVAFADFHRRSIEDRDAFWSEQAKLVDWETQPQQICDYSNPPFAKWFVGGKTNICHNAIDRHLKDRSDQAALIFVSTETNQEHTYTFRDLHAEVQRMAAILLQLGGGLAVLAGYQTKIAAFLLAGLTLVISIVMHDFWDVTEAVQRGHETQNFVKNMGIMAGLLAMAGLGAGPFSLDNRKEQG